MKTLNLILLHQFIFGSVLCQIFNLNFPIYHNILPTNAFNISVRMTPSNLPQGLILNNTSGIISGIPKQITNPVNYTFLANYTILRKRIGRFVPVNIITSFNREISVKFQTELAFYKGGINLPDWMKTATNANSFIFFNIGPTSLTDCSYPQIPQDVINSIIPFITSGKKVIFSVGQYSATCNSTQLYNLLDSLLQRTKIIGFDFSIEGWVGLAQPFLHQIYDKNNVIKLARVINKLRRKYKDLYIAYTVQAVPYKKYLDGNIWKFGGNLNFGNDTLNVLRYTFQEKTIIDNITPMLVGWGWNTGTQPLDLLYKETIVSLANELQQITKFNLSRIYPMLGAELDEVYTRNSTVFFELMRWANNINLGRITWWPGLYTDNYYPPLNTSLQKQGCFKSTTLNSVPIAFLSALNITAYKPGYPLPDLPNKC